MKRPSIEPECAHNDATTDHVHPAGWTNPAPRGRYNLVSIGGGTAGLVTSIGGAMVGARTALVERRFLGGDCLVDGCVPSKALLRAARAVAEIRRADRFGVRVGQVEVDFPAVMERLRKVRAEISAHDSANRIAAAGVDLFLGEARFVGPDAMRVGDAELRFARAVITTGSRPWIPAIPGIQNGRVHTTSTIFTITALPRRLAVVGAGPTGCELAQAFARFGSEVTLLETNSRVLGREEPVASARVQAALRRDGVRVVLGARTTAILRNEGTTTLRLQTPEGHENLVADEILVAAGRVPGTDGLDLEAAGVYHDDGGIRVDDFLRTTNPRIYAAGDVCGGLHLTHAADAMARDVIRNALFVNSARHSRVVVPTVTYTDPEVASVGLTASAAAGRGIPIETFIDEFRELDRAILDEETEGLAMIHVRAGSDEIVGATVVSGHAGELIGELTLAMTQHVGLSRIGNTVHPYPTTSGSLQRLGDRYNRGRLTPRLLDLLRRFLRWRR